MGEEGAKRATTSWDKGGLKEEKMFFTIILDRGHKALMFVCLPTCGLDDLENILFSTLTHFPPKELWKKTKKSGAVHFLCHAKG